MYASYEFYTDVFYGNEIAAADFPRLASRASDFIDYYTRNKAAAATEQWIVTALSKCCCALAERMQIDERSRLIAAQTTAEAVSSGSGEIKSETVGSHSVSYTTGADYASDSNAEKAQNEAYASICLRYLANTGLLYRGGCC